MIEISKSEMLKELKGVVKYYGEVDFILKDSFWPFCFGHSIYYKKVLIFLI